MTRPDAEQFVDSVVALGQADALAGRERVEHVDVLIVGAGLAGVGAACRLAERLPNKRVLIVEARDALGGTWDLFRYPGIRSDSDMLTLGYDFRPWQGRAPLADGPSIRRYIAETAEAHGVTERIRYQRRVTRLSWDSAAAVWTANLERTDGGGTERATAGFVYSCTGYYRYDEGYTPEFPGAERFQGQIVHPQHWPPDLDPAGKRFVVIGSGATAVTLVPALAENAAHVTMLQRSPSYVLSLPREDPLARVFTRLPARVAYRVARWRNILASTGMYAVSRRWPDVVRRLIRRLQKGQLPDADLDRHFTPRYDPWDQRLCIVPDGDLFKALRSGRASIVTDTIDTFTETGVRLSSGEVAEADVIVTATGLNLLMFGGMEFVVDGEPADVTKSVGVRGMMLSGLPNFVFAVGYVNASWTLKADLVAEHTCRLLAHMDAHGYDRVIPLPPPESEQRRPLMDMSSGYLQRGLHLMPMQGTRAPWTMPQNYLRDRRRYRMGAVAGEDLRFHRAPAASRLPSRPAPG